MLIDYLRETFGFAKYDPSEEEIKRYVTENYDYHERVTNLQYLPTEEEIIFLAKNLPIQITGEPTEDREVSNYKDLERVESNFIRGGMCLIFSEGLAQKAQKGLRLLHNAKAKGLVATGWEFLSDYIEIHKKREKGASDASPTYIKDIVAGRPVLSHPSRSGGLRFRYGKSRTNGFSATSIHPATMAMLDGFLSFGTQLKIEKPTKGCAISSCDSIDGPIVKLLNGSVRKVKELNEAKKLYSDVSEIIYLGDILFPIGDVINRNHELIKPGYVEEWWELELKNKNADLNIDKNVSFEEAVEISGKYNIPLYPKFIFYWKEIEYELFLALLDWIGHGKFSANLVLPYNAVDKERFAKGKRALELIGCEHEVGIEHVIVKEEIGKALLFNLGIENRQDLGEEVDRTSKILDKNKDVLENINKLCKAVIKDKSGTFIGARMGRPEKAKLRKLVGSPHVLFPVGSEGGRLRSIQAAVEAGKVTAEFPLYFCEGCGKEGIYLNCENCKSACVKRYYCSKCDKVYSDKCEEHGNSSVFMRRSIDIRTYVDNAKKIAGVRAEELPSAIKGVRGTSNKEHICEHLGKGFLRAKHGLNVNKDGTIRYDITEMVITHFKPKEIGTSIGRLKELGYEKDIYGNELENDEQVLEIFPQDIILPSCPDTPDEKADDVFLKVAKFVDDELEKLYGLPGFYKLNRKEELIGSLFACIAPHICTAVVGRVIGFSKTQTFLASPFMHAALRRDCDGDECAVMLLLDTLLNFSLSFLPAHRGGTQDAPLVLNSKINAGEVDEQILDFEVGPYPLEIYELAEQGKHSSEVKIETIKTRLKERKEPFRNLFFTHDTDDINACVLNSSYKRLPTMHEKVTSQMNLCKKIRAVDASDVARLVIERHFIRDIRGNLRKFSMQEFRCVDCNEKFRRVPLRGVCTSCGGKLMFTISEGSIIKYLNHALELARSYNVSSYLLECLEITEKDIESIFGREKEKQEALNKWFG